MSNWTTPHRYTHTHIDTHNGWRQYGRKQNEQKEEKEKGAEEEEEERKWRFIDRQEELKVTTFVDVDVDERSFVAGNLQWVSVDVWVCVCVCVDTTWGAIAIVKVAHRHHHTTARRCRWWLYPWDSEKTTTSSDALLNVCSVCLHSGIEEIKKRRRKRLGKLVFVVVVVAFLLRLAPSGRATRGWKGTVRALIAFVSFSCHPIPSHAAMQRARRKELPSSFSTGTKAPLFDCFVLCLRRRCALTI